MKSWPGSWVTVWWVRKHSANNLGFSEQKLIFWIIYIYFNCSWKLLSVPSTLSPRLTINSWRTNGRVKYLKHFCLCNMHLKCALGVFTVKYFKTLVFLWIFPFPCDLKNTSLKESNACDVYWKKGTYNETLPYVLGFCLFLNLLWDFGWLFLLPNNSPNDETCVLIWAKPLVP